MEEDKTEDPEPQTGDLPTELQQELLDLLGLETRSTQARRQRIEEFCRQHQQRAEEIREFIAALESAEDRIMAALCEDATASVPDRIGPFRILRRLGRGGFGTVFKAERREPVRQIVALKVIEARHEDRQDILTRFELERRALAAMEHENVARFVDAGTTNGGRPWFAMEFVDGMPFSSYCDQHRLSLDERIALFQQVCSGVQHAHQKGVVHRDLKPDNVLVVRRGEQHTVKIVDFGIARATNRELLRQTLETAPDRVMGTPLYMAPEQAEPGGKNVDARADVYALGAMLYEILSGGLPFLKAELEEPFEFFRKLKEVDPPRPSERVATTEMFGVTTPADARRSTPRGLQRELRGDLDWIVMKALSKEPERRYGSAAELALDLQRHVDMEPVMAGPPSVGYRFRKFIRRYRGQVIAAGVVLVTLLGGLAGTTHFMFAERDQAQLANIALQKAETSLENFNRVANIVKLREAREAEKRLYPAWPETVGMMKRWLDEYSELEQKLPELKQLLDGLRRRTRPPSEEELEVWRQQSPRWSELAMMRAKHQAYARAQELRTSNTDPVTAALEATIPEDVGGLNDLAFELVGPDRTEFGREAEGLALAQLAWQKAQGADPLVRATVADTLAWAWFANGKDGEAFAMNRIALTEAPEENVERFRDSRERLTASVEAWRGESGVASLARAGGDVAALEREIDQGRGRRFDDQLDQFLHDTMEIVVGDLEAFVAPATGELPRVRERLSWAEGLRERSITAHSAKWEEARAEIRRSTRYASPRVNLREQLGLVPIGMNPNSRLWEFYHLRSAADPDSIPVRDDSGEIRVTHETGIIFVLIPGGTFTMGAQSGDQDAPNYDPGARSNEVPHEVTMKPYFLAKHEMTQGQWARLSNGREPSFYRDGWDIPEDRAAPVNASHPVENVSWDMCRELLLQHGLELPSENQWEYACRAGSSTPWSTGQEHTSLVGHANILDETAVTEVPEWGRAWGIPEGLDDGYVIHAPVGSFSPNEFGLFDMHGNVWEWCQDAHPSSSIPRINRGGCYTSPPELARSSYRADGQPSFRVNSLGVRASRAVR